MAFPGVFLCIHITLLHCVRQCVFPDGTTRGTRRTATLVSSLMPLETLWGTGSCGVHQECAKPRQTMLHAAVLLGVPLPIDLWPKGLEPNHRLRNPTRLVVLRSKNPKAAVS